MLYYWYVFSYLSYDIIFFGKTPLGNTSLLAQKKDELYLNTFLFHIKTIFFFEIQCLIARSWVFHPKKRFAIIFYSLHLSFGDLSKLLLYEAL